MRPLMYLLGFAAQFALGASTFAANMVQIESKMAAPGTQNVPIGIRLTNDMPLQAFVLPLEIRSVTPGAFITAMKMSFAGRLDSALTDAKITAQFGNKSFTCADGDMGFGDVLYKTANEKHPVNGSPEGALFVRVRIQSPQLDPGTDVTPSMYLTVDMGQTTGTFEIDTTCTSSNNHVCFAKESMPPFTYVIPAFTKGIITIANCDCSHHGDLNGDGVFNVLDATFLIHYVFLGEPIPPKDASCPHVDRGDVNCNGWDDVFDVLYLNRYLYSGGPAPCNPCACNPYPSNCP